MTRLDLLAVEFEGQRPHLKSVAYRMLGSLTEADDAVQEAWLRLARTDTGEIGNLPGWLTTVVSRLCLDMLRTRTARREESLEVHLPDPVVGRDDATDPEQQVLLADSLGLALQVVLAELAPPERLAFVLHDIFGLPFEQIAPIVDRTPVAAKKLASRARQRIRAAAPSPDSDPGGQRRVIDAFQRAARDGDFDALLSILDPDVVLGVDGGVLTGGLQILRGAATVAAQAANFQRMATAAVAYPVRINGTSGLINTIDGELRSVTSFTVTGGRIVGIQILSDPERLSRLELAELIG
ncbi:MAG: polymerase subunit sigma-70 [Nocardia sp.]|uniref:sigma-70 family RNA polymerase sigma factor n=1 Tax=Nocardia sp. TaxID=1821 RepID=UPI00262FA707|nr:sigma-70 family RNA polymerase sigma factor [Nocardia sp.]MCU1646796.1 polymerase subunit sigma-70 [Nocardia sp.]